MLNKLKNEDNYNEIKEVLMPKEYNLIVTPKEIDELIENEAPEPEREEQKEDSNNDEE